MGRQRWGVAALVVALIVVALAAVVGLGDAASKSRVTLTVRVSGHGNVLIDPGGRSCHSRCHAVVPAGTPITLRARPAAGNHLGLWAGACSARANVRCVVRPSDSRTVTARFARDGALVSWNPYYKCKPTLTTIPAILGSQQDSLGGATEAGGGFQPHLSGGLQQHLLNPPCSIGGTTTFVEIHDVVVAEVPERSSDGDHTANVVDPNRPDIKNVYMKTIGTEIDNLLIGHHVAPPFQPPKGTHIDIQGFIFWDPAHTTTQWHAYSGWELHTITAWRPAAH